LAAFENFDLNFSKHRGVFILHIIAELLIDKLVYYYLGKVVNHLNRFLLKFQRHVSGLKTLVAIIHALEKSPACRSQNPHYHFLMVLEFGQVHGERVVEMHHCVVEILTGDFKEDVFVFEAGI
jgi:hypothetical protein